MIFISGVKQPGRQLYYSLPSTSSLRMNFVVCKGTILPLPPLAIKSCALVTRGDSLSSALKRCPTDGTSNEQIANEVFTVWMCYWRTRTSLMIFLLASTFSPGVTVLVLRLSRLLLTESCSHFWLLHWVVAKYSDVADESSASIFRITESVHSYSLPGTVSPHHPLVGLKER
jgi:hypothetical protein